MSSYHEQTIGFCYSKETCLICKKDFGTNAIRPDSYCGDCQSMLKICSCNRKGGTIQTDCGLHMENCLYVMEWQLNKNQTGK